VHVSSSSYKGISGLLHSMGSNTVIFAVLKASISLYVALTLCYKLMRLYHNNIVNNHLPSTVFNKCIPGV